MSQEFIVVNDPQHICVFNNCCVTCCNENCCFWEHGKNQFEDYTQTDFSISEIFFEGFPNHWREADLSDFLNSRNLGKIEGRERELVERIWEGVGTVLESLGKDLESQT